MKKFELYIDKQLTSFHIQKFDDGSIIVSVDNELNEVDTVDIYAYIESMNDLMVVACIKDAINHKNAHYNDLYITSPIYTRCDRNPENTSNSLRAFSRFVNAMNFDNIHMYDIHSQNTKCFIENLTEIHVSVLLTKFLNHQHFNIIAPDFGAKSKLINQKIYPNIWFDKIRDESGLVSEMKLKYSNYDKNNNLIVIDDICDRGGTFIELSNHFTSFDNVELYITHGLFNQDCIHKLIKKYQIIYVYFMKESVYNSLSEHDKKYHVRVHTVIEGV